MSEPDLDPKKIEAALVGAEALVDKELRTKDLLRSLPLDEFNALPRLTNEEIQSALDKGRPLPPIGGGWNPGRSF
jgi:hypothetical protein